MTTMKPATEFDIWLRARRIAKEQRDMLVSNTEESIREALRSLIVLPGTENDP